jgi:hypothetical protein
MVQKLLFPEGIVVNPDVGLYQTSNLTPIFRLIYHLQGMMMV